MKLKLRQHWVQDSLGWLTTKNKKKWNFKKQFIKKLAPLKRPNQTQKGEMVDHISCPPFY